MVTIRLLCWYFSPGPITAVIDFKRLLFLIWSVHLNLLWYQLLIFFKFIMVSNTDFFKFILVSITDFVHRIQFQKMKILLLISQDWNLILQCKQPWTSWLKKMSGGYLVRKSWRWLLGSRISWPPRASEGGGHLWRHSLDPSLLSSTLIVDKKQSQNKEYILTNTKLEPGSIHTLFQWWFIFLSLRC